MPFLDHKLELYVDGSLYFMGSNCVMGYSITSEWSSGDFTLGLKRSVQAAELVVLTRACQLAKEMSVNTLILDMHLEYAMLLGSYGSCVGLYFW